jgi:hypothetical protein
VDPGLAKDQDCGELLAQATPQGPRSALSK